MEEMKTPFTQRENNQGMQSTESLNRCLDTAKESTDFGSRQVEAMLTAVDFKMNM
ncbi:MAG: hypothetical protein NC089_02025 [Bacteroides sp.]|nr:hypothetical protein [Bacteroides sp.]MCM1548901.1 hypothetical protein [Clostridium sp.]